MKTPGVRRANVAEENKRDVCGASDCCIAELPALRQKRKRSPLADPTQREAHACFDIKDERPARMSGVDTDFARRRPRMSTSSVGL